MAKTLQYWGTGNFQEHPYTGRIVTWTEKEKQTVDDAIATKLLASGAGFVLDNDETGEVVTYRIDPVTGGIVISAEGKAVANLPKHPPVQVVSPVVIPRRVFCQLQNGKYLCTDLDNSYGKYGARLYTYDGDIRAGTGTKENLIYTEVTLGDVYDASGTVIVGGANAGITQAWQIENGDIFLLAAGKTGYTTKFYLFRAKAGTYTIGSGVAATDKKAVLNLGTLTGLDVPGSQVDAIRALHSRSFAEIVVSVNGTLTRKLLLAEYNVAAGRVSGSTNDQVICWQSTDGGLTWSKLLEFNTSVGQHRFDHFHAVVQDPRTRLVYFLTGDNGDECAILVWDGKSAAPAANSTLAQIASTAGWSVIYGDELKRYGDLIFTADGIVGLPDCDTEDTEGGTTGFVSTQIDRWLRYVAAQNAFTRAADVIPLIALRASSGAMIYGSLRTQSANTTNNPYLDFWTSADGKYWHNSLKVRNYLSNTGNIKELFEDAAGNIIATASYGGGVQFTSDTQSGTSVVFSLENAPSGTPSLVNVN